MVKTDDKYKKLGISLKNSNGTLKSSEQVLFDSIDALSKMSDETKSVCSTKHHREGIFVKPLSNTSELLLFCSLQDHSALKVSSFMFWEI